MPCARLVAAASLAGAGHLERNSCGPTKRAQEPYKSRLLRTEKTSDCQTSANQSISASRKTSGRRNLQECS